MMQIFGAILMGMFFLLISGDLRAKFMDALAAAADALDKCGPSAYIGLAIVVIGGFLIVVQNEQEKRARCRHRIIVPKNVSTKRPDSKTFEPEELTTQSGDPKKRSA